MWSSLPAWLPQEPSDLSGLEPGSPPWYLAYFWVAFGHHSRSPASPPDHQDNHLIWVDSSLMAPLKFPLATAHSVQPSQLISDLNGLDPDSPPWLKCKFPLKSPWDSFVGQSPINIYCQYSDYIMTELCNIVTLFSLLSDYDHCCQSVPGNVFQVFWSLTWLQHLHSKSITIMHHKTRLLQF